MPEIVVKVLNDQGGDEVSIGPVPISKADAKAVTDLVEPHARRAAERVEKERAEQVEQDSRRRSTEAEEANQEHIRAGQKQEMN